MIVRTEDACYEVEELPDRSFKVVMREVFSRPLPPPSYLAACEQINDWVAVDNIAVKIGCHMTLSGLRRHSNHADPCHLRQRSWMGGWARGGHEEAGAQACLKTPGKPCL